MRSVVAAGLALGFCGGAASACPDYMQSGPGGKISGMQIAGGLAYDVQAGGGNDIRKCPNVVPATDVGAGYFTSRPDFTFDMSGMAGRRLAVSVVSACDAALLINTASATWYYDDDDNGNLDPRITLSRPADGYIDIWIGTYDGDVCDAQLQLRTY
ncbi:hypothetical protein EU805_06615 [Salipiger sp. IMCC34102]|nr:hypothetical protein EU805_06615 [Salipiger sp. IMCC34102]